MPFTSRSTALKVKPDWGPVSIVAGLIFLFTDGRPGEAPAGAASRGCGLENWESVIVPPQGYHHGGV